MQSSLSSWINSSEVQKFSNEVTCTPKKFTDFKRHKRLFVTDAESILHNKSPSPDFSIRTLYQAGSGWYLQVDLHCHLAGWRKLDDLEAVSLVAWGGSM